MLNNNKIDDNLQCLLKTNNDNNNNIQCLINTIIMITKIITIKIKTINNTIIDACNNINTIITTKPV